MNQRRGMLLAAVLTALAAGLLLTGCGQSTAEMPGGSAVESAADVTEAAYTAADVTEVAVVELEDEAVALAEAPEDMAAAMPAA